MTQYTVKFTARDLGAIRFAVSPLQHLVLGVLLQGRQSHSAQRWWRQARRNVPHAAAPLVELITAHPWYTPDFLTPPAPSSRATGPSAIAHELDALHATAPGQIEEELRLHRDPKRLPRQLSALKDGDSRELTRLVSAARAMYLSCLADEWPDIRQRLRADISQHAAVMAADGVESMLTGLNCGWNSAATSMSFGLTADGEFTDTGFEAALDGNGIVLFPSVFADMRPSPIITPWQQAALVYPVRPAAERAAPDRDGLSALIGRGRAAALRAIGPTVTTAELAARLGVSAPAASVHASDLRAAGLVSTVRDGRRVLHSLTKLGADLLDANPAPRRAKSED